MNSALGGASSEAPSILPGCNVPCIQRRVLEADVRHSHELLSVSDSGQPVGKVQKREH